MEQKTKSSLVKLGKLAAMTGIGYIAGGDAGAVIGCFGTAVVQDFTGRREQERALLNEINDAIGREEARREQQYLR